MVRNTTEIVKRIRRAAEVTGRVIETNRRVSQAQRLAQIADQEPTPTTPSPESPTLQAPANLDRPPGTV